MPTTTTNTTTTPTPPPTPKALAGEWQCARCGAIDQRSSRRASFWIVGLSIFTFLALMWHPLLALVLIIGAVAFRMTTRRRICDACGYDGREDTRRGFQLGSDNGETRNER